MAATITTLYKDYVNGQEEGIISVSIPSSDILLANSTPIDIIDSPGANKAVLLTGAVFRIDTYGGIPYATNTNLSLVYDTSLTIINIFSARLATASICKFLPSNNVVMGIHISPTSIESNKKVQLYVSGGNPTAGNSTIIVYVSYKIIPAN